MSAALAKNSAIQSGAPRKIKVYDLEDICRGFHALNLQSNHISHPNGRPTELGAKLHEYFRYRADVLNTFVRPHLMDARRARSTFTELYTQLQPTCPIPKNKQKGEKSRPSIPDSHCEYAHRGSFQWGYPVTTIPSD